MSLSWARFIFRLTTKISTTLSKETKPLANHLTPEASRSVEMVLLSIALNHPNTHLLPQCTHEKADVGWVAQGREQTATLPKPPESECVLPLLSSCRDSR